MAYGELLTLMLHAPLPYRGLENPPLRGLPPPGTAARALSLVAAAEGSEGAAPSEPDSSASDLAEGEEELFIFDEEELVLFDPEEGPRVARPLPAPRFYGRGGRAASSGRPRRGSGPATGAAAPPAAAAMPPASAAMPPASAAMPPASAAMPPAAAALPPASAAASAASAASAAGAERAAELPARELSAGRYLFMQWRPADEEEAAEGIEWFAREAWWERAGGVGPWILRRVAEDGKLAVQVLRALA